MFTIKNVPIVIEPGVRALETEFVVDDPKAGQRILPITMARVALDEKSVTHLPFIPTNRCPHVFSVNSNLEKSAALLVYDAAGRINTLYTKDERTKVWDRFNISEEHAGKTVTQFSVRFVFNTQKDRAKFLDGMEKITRQVGREETPNMEDVIDALRPLARSRVAPVVVPLAVEKSQLGKIKL